MKKFQLVWATCWRIECCLRAHWISLVAEIIFVPLSVVIMQTGGLHSSLAPSKYPSLSRYESQEIPLFQAVHAVTLKLAPKKKFPYSNWSTLWVLCGYSISKLSVCRTFPPHFNHTITTPLPHYHCTIFRKIESATSNRTNCNLPAILTVYCALSSCTLNPFFSGHLGTTGCP